MTQPVRLAVAGAGDIGRRHMGAIQRNARCVLCGVADPTPNADAASASFGVPSFASLPELIDDAAPEGVIIATPNATHVELTRLCIERKIPALVEKPVADSVAGAYALAELAEARGVAVLVGHHRRHNPLIRRAKSLIAAGAIGEVVAVSATWLARKPDTYFDVRWRREPGGGPILINLIHDIDTLRHLVGEIVAVHGVTASRRRGFDVEDSAAIITVFESGALATIALSDAAPSPWSWELTAGEATSYRYPRVNADCYLIAGSEAALAIPSLRLWRHDGLQSWQSPMLSEDLAVEPADPIAAQLQHFCDVVRGEASPLVTARDAARSLEVTLSVSEAASVQGRVAVPVGTRGQAAAPGSARGPLASAC